jgi:hypothetical protein
MLDHSAPRQSVETWILYLCFKVVLIILRCVNIHLLIVYGNTTIATDQHEFVESDMAGIHARSTLVKLMRSVK